MQSRRAWTTRKKERKKLDCRLAVVRLKSLLSAMGDGPDGLNEWMKRKEKRQRCNRCDGCDGWNGRLDDTLDERKKEMTALQQLMPSPARLASPHYCRYNSTYIQLYPFSFHWCSCVCTAAVSCNMQTGRDQIAVLVHPSIHPTAVIPSDGAARFTLAPFGDWIINFFFFRLLLCSMDKKKTSHQSIDRWCCIRIIRIDPSFSRRRILDWLQLHTIVFCCQCQCPS